MQYRNSLVLPHMRSTYLPQCGNQQYSEAEIKVSHLKRTSKMEKTFTVDKSNPDLPLS